MAYPRTRFVLAEHVPTSRYYLLQERLRGAGNNTMVASWGPLDEAHYLDHDTESISDVWHERGQEAHVVDPAWPAAEGWTTTAATTRPGSAWRQVDQWYLPEGYVTPAEAAARTGDGESTWRWRAAHGKVDGAVKKGKQWLLPAGTFQGVTIQTKPNMAPEERT